MVPIRVSDQYLQFEILDGMVNSESDFNENSFEKAEENVKKIQTRCEGTSSIQFI